MMFHTSAMPAETSRTDMALWVCPRLLGQNIQAFIQPLLPSAVIECERFVERHPFEPSETAQLR